MTTPSTTPPDLPGTGAPAADVPATMPALVADRYGTPEVLRIEEVPTPEPGDGEVLIGVAASSLNPLDHHHLTGTPYLIRPTSGLRRPRHRIRGADVAGTVVAVGPGVTTFRPGDAVFGECGHGSLAPFTTASADHLVEKPANVSFEAAAATPVAGLTALQGLRTHAAVRPGDQVLVNGAAGGVGTFAVQIATALGAYVTAVCSTRNVERVRDLGAVEVIDYHHDDFVARGRRFDVMLDNVGNRSPRDCLDVLRPDGRYVAVSGPMENRWLGPIPSLLRSRLAFRRAGPSFHQFIASPDRDDLQRLAELLATGQIVPAVDRVVGLGGVAEGLAGIATGHTPAKIVVVPH